MPKVAYWTDIFTLETWAQAEKTGFSVSGFPAPTAGKGGYSTGMFDRVQTGDILLCYCKGPATRWVGALSVTGPVFQDAEPVWGLAESGEVRFPWRFPIEPVITLDPARGVPGSEVAASVGFLSRLKHWGVYLQRSLNPVPDEDGDLLLSMLREPRTAVPIVVPQRRARRRVRVDQPEPGHLEAQAQPVQLAAVDPAEAQPETESRVHTEIQAKLRDIGLAEGFDVWVADRGIEWEGALLGGGCLGDLPVVANERTRAVMKNIDVMWFRRGTGHPIRFFEIEHSTTVYSGLLRFNDVMIDFPIPEAFIVGDGEKTQRKFEREIARRTFEASRLIDVTRFLFYEQVRQTWQLYRTVGSGSRSWGATTSSNATQRPA
jgi:hypothetical protein